MADPHRPAPQPELSPYQQLENERIAAVATACHKANMRTADFNDNACAGSVSAIVEKATGQQLREPIAPRMERATGPHALRGTGHVDLQDKAKTNTADVRPGDLAFYADSGKYFPGTGRVETTHHVGVVTGTTHEGHVSHILSNGSTHRDEHGKVTVPGSFRNDMLSMYGDDRSVQFYRMPATQESVHHMINHVPRVGDNVVLHGYNVESLGRDGQPLKEKDVPKLDVPTHDWTKPKDGWSMPGLEKGPDGTPKTSPDSQFKGITLQEAMFEAQHGKSFAYEHAPDRPKLTPLQDETLKRAVLAHLPAQDQDRYAARMKLDGPTANEFAKKEYGPMPADCRTDAANRMQLAIVQSKGGKVEVPDFKPAPGGLSQEQADKLNAMMHDTIEKHLPHQKVPDRPQEQAPGSPVPNGARPVPGEPGTPAPDPPPPLARRDGFVQSGTIVEVKDGVVSQAVGRGKIEQYALADFSGPPPEVGKRMTVAYADGQATAREPARELAQVPVR